MNAVDDRGWTALPFAAQAGRPYAVSKYARDDGRTITERTPQVKVGVQIQAR